MGTGNEGGSREGREIDAVECAIGPNRRNRRAPWHMRRTPAGDDFGATRSKSANTNPSYAHRLFSSAHQPAQHPYDARPPAHTTPSIQAAARWICVRRLRGFNPPGLALSHPHDVNRPTTAIAKFSHLNSPA